MTCKDCLHCEVCFIREMLYMNASKTHWMNCDDCLHFKDKTQWASQRWIPVTERLPKPFENVIGWTKYRERGVVSHNGKRFVWEDDEGDYAHVTHWMPLPTPPKED